MSVNLNNTTSQYSSKGKYHRLGFNTRLIVYKVQDMDLRTSVEPADVSQNNHPTCINTALFLLLYIYIYGLPEECV